MVAFAKKILGEKLDKKLALYNTVLTTSFRGNQALLRYPFYDYKEKKQFRAPPEAFNGDGSMTNLYTAAEKAFVDSRSRQEKVYAMVLWAIKVLESDCQLKTPCTAPPFTSVEFKKDYDAYTKDQLVAFNEGLDWLLFTYGNARRESVVPAELLRRLSDPGELPQCVGGGRRQWRVGPRHQHGQHLGRQHQPAMRFGVRCRETAVLLSRSRGRPLRSQGTRLVGLARRKRHL